MFYHLKRTIYGSFNATTLCHLILMMLYPSMTIAATHLGDSDSGWFLFSDTDYIVEKNITVSSNSWRQSAITIPGKSNLIDISPVIYPLPDLSPFPGIALPESVTLTNYGVISGPNEAPRSAGVAFFNHGVLNNMRGGIIRGDDHAIMLGYGQQSVNNDGTINATLGNAISINNNLAIIRNRGDITGEERGIDARDSGPLQILNIGKIAANKHEAIVINTDSQVVNAGKIESLGAPAILMAGGNNDLILQTGSQLAGKEGTALLSNGQNNKLVLAGKGREDGNFLSNLADNGLGRITVQQNSEWILNGILQAFGTDDDVLDVAGNLTLGGTLTIEGGGGATVEKGGILAMGDNGTLKGQLFNQGMMAFEESSTSGHGSVFTLAGNLINAGDIFLSPAGRVAGNTLAITGDFEGQANSTLHLNGRLNGDASPIEHMTIAGNASGMTEVAVTNVGGTGASTLEGIEIITVGGRSSENTFVQKGRIIAGRYDYFLHREEVSRSDGSRWFLSSKPQQRPPANDFPTISPQTSASAVVTAPVLRPEVGSYAVNNAATNSMFVTRLTDRQPANNVASTLWFRQSGTHQQSRAGGQLENVGNQYVTQLGGEVTRFSVGQRGALHFGVMAGYGSSRGHSESDITGYRSKNSVNGYSSGINMTWYADEQQHHGFYSDNWVQYSAFKNNVKGEQLANESYHSQGLTASTELGYTFSLPLANSRKLVLQPQIQTIWMGVDADDHQESNGSRVKSTGKNNVLTRTGIRVAVDSPALRPFVEVSWLHNSKQAGVSIDDITTDVDGTPDIFEIKPGIRAQLFSGLDVIAEAGLQKGANHYQNMGGMIGIRYAF
ncbi:autotransporter outer membrane beta-barrel domain-containing protein [Enterobacteriaceae bacterium RIT714]|nr:autotransporter outer membrane beta-barrel domain-containing protein [Enterobacteriaceae bacterium RIT714]